MAFAQLDGHVTELVFEPGAPADLDVIAGLQNGPQPPRAPAHDEAEMSAVRAAQHFHDGTGLAVRTRSR